MTLTGSGGNATVDTAGYTATFAGALSGPGGLTKTDSGTLVLSAMNTYTGPTAVNGGILSLTGSLSASTSLAVGGGTFSYAPTANGGTGNSQTVAGLTVNAGLSGVNASAGNTLALGSIVQNTGGGVDFNSGTAGTITTTRANTNGILGPWATYGSGTSLTYAAASGGSAPYTIVAYTGATPITSGVIGLTGTTGTVNYTLSSGGGTLAAAVAANTIQFTGSANTITASAANSLSLNGIMNDGSGTATITGGNLIIGSSKELVFTGPGNMTVGSVIQDNGGGPSALTMAGSGTLVLSAANTYSGLTTITSGGTLQIGNGGATGSINDTSGVTDNGTLAFDLSSSSTFSNAVTGTGGLTQMASSVLCLTGSNTYTGPTTISGGTLQLGGSTSLGNSPAVTFNGATGVLDLHSYSPTIGSLSGGGTVTNSTASTTSTLTLAPASSSTATFNGVIQNGSGTVALTVSDGTQILTGSNTYTGVTTIGTGATLQIGNGSTGSINSTNGVTDNGLLVFDISSGTFSKNISGTGGLTQTAPSVLNISGLNSYSGQTTISAGTLQIGNSNALEGSTAVSFGGNSGILDLNGNSISIASLSSVSGGTVTNNATGSGTQTLTLASTAAATATFAGVIQNGPTRTVALTLNSAGLDEVLAGVNTYTGSTTITAGTLGLGSNTALGSLTPVTFTNTSGVLDLGGYSPTIISLTGSGTVTNSSVGSTSTLTLAPTSGSTTLNGVIQSGAGTVGLTFSGTGTVVLAGSNTYTGPTTITAGTLQIGNGGATGSINGTSGVTNNGVLEFYLSSGTTTFSPAISGGGGLAQNGSSLLILAGSNTYTGQTTISAGTLQIGNGGTTGSVGSTSGVADSGLLAFDLSTAATFSQTITGSGGLMQMGPSVLTLTGSNTYAGLTTIASGGTLQIGNGSTGSINSTSGVADNGLLAFDLSSGTTTVGNSITGIGGLLQMANVLALTGSNTYSGPTTISAGTIQLGGSTSLGNLPAVSINSSTGELDLHGYSPTIISLTGSGTLINSSVSSTSTLTLAPTSGTSTFSGVITNGAGTVALTVRGAGTVVLAGSNTYTGPTTISAGTLQIGSGGTSGSINGASTVTDNSLLAFDLSGTMTLSAAISGGGGLSQIYPSLLILTGSNTYSGQTTISAGTLQIGNGGTTGSIGSTSGVGDNAALAFDLSTAATFSQTVTGSGGLMQLGPSVLTLTGSNTYTGLTTIASGGTLQIGNGTTGSINSTSSVTDNGLLVFDTSSGTFSKNVSGSGGLTQMASSVLNLGGVNSYSGPTTISAGTLQLGSNTALGNSSAVSVNLGAVLDLDSYSPTFGSLTGSGTVTNTAGSGTSTLTLTPASGSTAAFTGIIQNGSGTVALTLNGNGALLLSDSSTYTGATTITAGTLQIGGGGTTGSINGTSGVTDNGLLAFDLYATTTFTPAISGSGGLSQNGSSLLILAGSETFTGRITIGGGTLAFDLSPGTTTLSNSISGSGGLTQMGPSLLVLTGSDTYSGQTTIASGATLQIGNGSTGSINSTSSVADNGLLVFDISSGTFSKNISGSGGLTQLASSLLRMSGANTYRGPTTISAGTIQLGSSTALGSSSAVSISSGAVLDLDNISAMIGSLTGSGTVTNTAASNTATLTLKPAAGSISTFSGIIQNGSTANVALTLNGNGTEVLTGSNTYTGTTTITAGTLQLGDGTSKNGSVAGKITDNAQLTFANPNAQTYSGMITGSGSLTKTGTGVLTLTGSNIYTGGTTVELGVLVIANGSNGSATGSGTVILSGGTLASGSGGGSIADEVEVGTLPAEIAPGGIGAIGKLTIGSLLTSSNLTLNFDLTGPKGSNDLLVVTGNLALAAGTDITFGADPTTYGDYPLIGYGSLTGSLSDLVLPAPPPYVRYSLSTTVDPGYIDLVAVPEPSTLVLLGVAALGLWGWAWRRQRRSSFR